MLLFPGAIFVIAGAVVSRFPPKKINGFYGYRTPTSQRSQAAWDFANRYGARQMMSAGVVYVLLVMALTQVGLLTRRGATIVGVLGAAAWILIRTETALHRRFDGSGAPRRRER
jgi:uncharacterized membrane protein